PRQSLHHQQKAGPDSQSDRVGGYELLLFGDIAGSPVSSVFGAGANRLFRRFAGSGVNVIVMLRPVIFGSISTCDIVERSSRTFSISCMPNSWCAISRPRNCNCTRTLFPRSRNSSP